MKSRLIPIALTSLAFSICTPAAPVFLDAQGNEINTVDWKNKWMVINYWAGWCDACATEIPELNLFYQHHIKKIRVFGVNYDNLPINQLQSATQTMHIHFPVLQTNPAKTLHLPHLDVLPTTFIINPQGKVIQQLSGPQTADRLEKIINASH